MKSWKEWPYWGRGAFIGVILCLVFIIFQAIIAPEFFYNICGEVYCLSPFARGVQGVYNTSLFPLLNSLLADFLLSSQVALNIAAMTYYFFIGAFLGLIYGKIRHGKDTIHPPR